MACKMIFVLSVVVAVLYREMLFTDAQYPGYGASNVGVKQGFPPQRQMIPGQMNPGQMNPGRMIPGQMNPGQMNPGQMFPGHTIIRQMNPSQMNPIAGPNGVGLPGPPPNVGRQPGARRPSTFDTLSMDVSKQVIRQLTPLAEVALSAPAAYGQAWAMAPGTAIRAAQPILGGAISAANWG